MNTKCPESIFNLPCFNKVMDAIANVYGRENIDKFDKDELIEMNLSTNYNEISDEEYMNLGFELLNFDGISSKDIFRQDTEEVVNFLNKEIDFEDMDQCSLSIEILKELYNSFKLSHDEIKEYLLSNKFMYVNDFK